MSIFSSLGLSPKLGLNLLKNRIETELKTPISEYELHCDFINNNAISFRIVIEGEKRVYPFKDPGGILSTMLKKYTTSNLKNGDTLDYLVIYYTKETVIGKMYFRDKYNEKQLLNEEL